jgi:hypothetical protein
VLLNAPSLRSDKGVARTLTAPVKDAALARPKIWEWRKNNMSVLLGYFLIAAGAGVAASGIVGLILAKLLIRRFEKG